MATDIASIINEFRGIRGAIEAIEPGEAYVFYYREGKLAIGFNQGKPHACGIVHATIFPKDSVWAAQIDARGIFNGHNERAEFMPYSEAKAIALEENAKVLAMFETK